jgi:FKBP-type peptidyl-prolyl cis-trans isomerase
MSDPKLTERLLRHQAVLARFQAGAETVNGGRRRPLMACALMCCAVLAAAQEPAAPPVPPEEPLVVKDLVTGIGNEARPGMVVVVHYVGWLYDASAKDHRGRQFDNSRERRQPLSFPLGAGHVIKGWDRGVAGMRVGGLRRLVIPPALAYGSRNIGNGLIPPGSTLVFDVELLAVENASSATQAQ